MAMQEDEEPPGWGGQRGSITAVRCAITARTRRITRRRPVDDDGSAERRKKEGESNKPVRPTHVHARACVWPVPLHPPAQTAKPSSPPTPTTTTTATSRNDVGRQQDADLTDQARVQATVSPRRATHSISGTLRGGECCCAGGHADTPSIWPDERERFYKIAIRGKDDARQRRDV